MTPIVFPRCVGQVQHVDIGFYDDIISDYVDRVRGVPGVLGVTRMGSFSTPGLSDIDIIITIADKGPCPAWEQISLMPVARIARHGEVVLHDVFVISESIARHMEAFFFVDHEIILWGNGLGGQLLPEGVRLFNRMLTVEYAFHRLESLIATLLRPYALLRDTVLLISSTRHSASLAAEFGVIPESKATHIAEQISELRTKAVQGSITQQDLDVWPERIIRLMWTIIQRLGDQLTVGLTGPLPKTWCGSLKTAVIDSEASDGIAVWQTAITRQRSSRLRRRVKVLPAPVQMHRHVAAYCGLDSSDGRYLRSQYPSVGTLEDRDETRREARRLRASLVRRHWEFLRQADYLNSSGKGYIGVNMPTVGRWQDKILAIMRNIQARRVVSSLAKRSPT